MSTSYLNRLGAIDFSRTIERLAEGFTGREWLFDKLDDWLQQEDGEMFYLLTGEPGVGKSAIAARLTQRWADANPEKAKLAAYHFCRAGDVETVRPGRVLRSLATQLGKTLPHYGEALKEVLDQVHVRIDVNINIDRLSNSQVTGIYVENLKDLDPREEFRLLIQAPLAELAKIYAKPGNTPPLLKVFLIDSLDEAATTTGQENMVTLLASLYQARETLPPWVRFLFTARPDQAVLNRFLPLQSEKIEEMKDDNLSDIEEYIQGRVDDQLPWEPSTPERQANTALVANLKPLPERLDEADITAEKLVQEVKQLSHGNFLYTKLLLNSIAAGEQSIKNLSALPKDLNEIYHRTLRYRCSFRGWLKRYQPILGTLSVTQEPISQAQLGKFTRIKAEELEKNLAVFRQFLDESKDEQGQPLYAIFHQSLREYLLDRNHNHDFWCDAKEQHDGIIQCFEDESEKWQNLRAIDLYGLLYLAKHLLESGRNEELYTLLTKSSDWMEAKFIGCTGDRAYSADLELAIGSFSDPLTPIQLLTLVRLHTARQIVYQRVTRYKDVDLETLVWLKRDKEAVSHARLRSQPKSKFYGLLVIYQTLSKRGQPDDALLEEVWEVARSIDGQDQAEVLLRLAVILAQKGDYLKANEIFTQVEQVAQAIRDTGEKTEALTQLAIALAQTENFAQAEKVLESIENDLSRVKVFSQLAAAMTRVGQKTKAHEIFTNAQTKAEQFTRSSTENFNLKEPTALRYISVALAQAGNFSQAEEIAVSINSLEQKTIALTELAVTLALAGNETKAVKVFTQAEQTARMDDLNQYNLLRDLAIALAQVGQFSYAEQVARSLWTEFMLDFMAVEALSHLASALARTGHEAKAIELITEVEQLDRSGGDKWMQQTVFEELVVGLVNAGQFTAAERIARIIEDRGRAALALEKVAIGLAEAGHFSQSEHLAQELTVGGGGIEVLTALAIALVKANQFVEVERVTQLIKDVNQYRDLTPLVMALADVKQFDLAEQIAQDIIQGEEDRAEAFAHLAGALAQAGHLTKVSVLITRAEQAAKSTAYYQQAGALRKVAVALAQAGQFAEAERIAQSISGDLYSGSSTEKAKAMLQLTIALIEVKQLTKAEQIARSIGGGSEQAEALRVLSVALVQAGKFAEAKRLVQDIEWKRTEALIQLDEALFQKGQKIEAGEVFLEAEQAGKLTGRQGRTDLIRDLLAAMKRPGQIERLEQVAHSLEDYNEKVFALSCLASALTQVGQQTKANEVIAEAEQVARLIGGWQQSDAFEHIAYALIDMGNFGQAERIIWSMRSSERRDKVLNYIGKIHIQSKSFQQAFTILGQRRLDDFWTLIAEWSPSFEEVEMGLSVSIMQEMARIIGWVRPGGCKLYDVLECKLS